MVGLRELRSVLINPFEGLPLYFFKVLTMDKSEHLEFLINLDEVVALASELRFVCHPHFLVSFVGSISLVFMLLYVWSREYPNAQINKYGLVSLKELKRLRGDSSMHYRRFQVEKRHWSLDL
ncbi:derlin-1 [Senna tora]|uniref:Derlin-1 n=1 Tax=Senna tora TaxID=362788 RepID=A0A834W4L7_9FABA|nr:derlin-1 [Senna tora]